MKTTRAQSILSLSCVQVLVAVLPFSAGAAMGTTSGSGGNGVANKAYESYIRDPLKLPAYLQYIKPIYDHITAVSPNAKDSSNIDIFRIKTWYFVPQNLKTLPKGAIGVSFLRGKMQQLALQTERAIWVDSTIFDASTTSLEDQADLILHEAVMTLYTMKFKKISEMLKIGDRLGVNQGNPTNIEMMDALMPPVPRRILNAEDYENIRTMMSWLKTEGRTATYKELVLQLRANDFDQRFAGQDEEKIENPENAKFIELSNSGLEDSFERAKVVGRWPSLCRSLGESKETPCALGFAKGVIGLSGFHNYPVPILKMQLRRNGVQDMALNFTLSGGDGKFSVSNWGTKDSDGHVIYVLGSAGLAQKARRGDRLTNTFLFFKNKGSAEKPRLEIEAVLFLPMVITDVETRDTEMGTTKTTCEAERPQSNRREDQPVIIRAPSFGKANYYLKTLSLPSVFKEISCYKD